MNFIKLMYCHIQVPESSHKVEKAGNCCWTTLKIMAGVKKIPHSTLPASPPCFGWKNITWNLTFESAQPFSQTPHHTYKSHLWDLGKVKYFSELFHFYHGRVMMITLPPGDSETKARPPSRPTPSPLSSPPSSFSPSCCPLHSSQCPPHTHAYTPLHLRASQFMWPL